MGFGGFFKKAVRQVVKPRTLAAIASFGTTELVRKVPGVGKPIAKAYEVGAETFVGAYTGGLSTLALGAARGLTAKPIYRTEVAPMGLNVGGILGAVGNIFGGAQNPYFQGISNVAGLAGQFFPQPTAQASTIAIRPPTPLPMVGGSMIGRAGAMIGRSFFNKFPNLATAIQGYRNAGRNVTRAQLWSMLKRFGPDILVTGGILTAAAVSELMMAGPGHRRMNPGNVKALRRSLRRLESFHHLCQRADKFRSRSRSRKVGKSSGSQQFVRQG